MLYHGVHNVAIQGIFDGSTLDTGWTKWITTELGLAWPSVVGPSRSPWPRPSRKLLTLDKNSGNARNRIHPIGRRPIGERGSLQAHGITHPHITDLPL